MRKPPLGTPPVFEEMTAEDARLAQFAYFGRSDIPSTRPSPADPPEWHASRRTARMMFEEGSVQAVTTPATAEPWFTQAAECYRALEDPLWYTICQIGADLASLYAIRGKSEPEPWEAELAGPEFSVLRNLKKILPFQSSAIGQLPEIELLEGWATRREILVRLFEEHQLRDPVFLVSLTRTIRARMSTAGTTADLEVLLSEISPAGMAQPATRAAAPSGEKAEPTSPRRSERWNLLLGFAVLGLMGWLGTWVTDKALGGLGYHLPWYADLGVLIGLLIAAVAAAKAVPRLFRLYMRALSSVMRLEAAIQDQDGQIHIQQSTYLRLGFGRFRVSRLSNRTTPPRTEGPYGSLGDPDHKPAAGATIAKLISMLRGEMNLRVTLLPERRLDGTPWEYLMARGVRLLENPTDVSRAPWSFNRTRRDAAQKTQETSWRKPIPAPAVIAGIASHRSVHLALAEVRGAARVELSGKFPSARQYGVIALLLEASPVQSGADIRLACGEGFADKPLARLLISQFPELRLCVLYSAMGEEPVSRTETHRQIAALLRRSAGTLFDSGVPVVLSLGIPDGHPEFRTEALSAIAGWLQKQPRNGIPGMVDLARDLQRKLQSLPLEQLGKEEYPYDVCLYAVDHLNLKIDRSSAPRKEKPSHD
jgi:hypothetical protein